MLGILLSILIIKLIYDAISAAHAQSYADKHCSFAYYQEHFSKPDESKSTEDNECEMEDK